MRRYPRWARAFSIAIAAGAIVIGTVVALADTPDPAQPTTGNVVVNGDDTLTVTVQGSFTWSRHCSSPPDFDRRVGWAVDWNDADQPGNVVGQYGGSGETIDVGVLTGDARNPADNKVYFEDDPPCGSWDGSSSTGTWGPLSHTYAAGTTDIRVCAVTYDVHNQDETSTEYQAGGAGHNDDNSVETNNSPIPGTCFQFSVPTLTTTASPAVDIGGAIYDTAHLSAGTSPTGTITFTAYGPDDSDCSDDPAFGPQDVSVDGNDDYESGHFTPTIPGVYRWTAAYNGDDHDLAVSSACGAAGESVEVTAHPALTVAKSGAQAAHEGDSVTYSFLVTNTGDITLTDVDVTDDLLGNVGTIPELGPGESDTLTKDHDVPDPYAAATVENCATAIGSVVGGGTATSPEDCHTLTVLHPAITLDKKVEGADHKPVENALQVHQGDDLHYTVVVTNTGDTPLEITSLVDSERASLAASCDRGVGTVLDPAETISCDYAEEAGADDVHDTASVEAVETQEQTGQAEVGPVMDETFVDVIAPGLIVEKSGPVRAHEGDRVTYTFVVTNVGDVALLDVGVSDDLLGSIGSIATLAPHASKTMTKTTTVPDDTDRVDNTVTACGSDVLDREVCDSDEHTVDVVHPAIEIVKGGPGRTHEGDEETYTFVVKNTGDVVLDAVDVTDDVMGSIGTVDSLDPSESKTLSKKYTIPADEESIHNTAEACGKDPTDEEVCDSDDHAVDVIYPRIELVKTAVGSTSGPLTVTFTYVVKNTGDTPLDHIRVTDDVYGDDIGTIDSLEAGGSNTIEIVKAVDGNSPNRNVGEVCGTDALGKRVCDTDDASIATVLAAALRAGRVTPVGELPATGAELRTWLLAAGVLLLLAAAALATEAALRRRGA